MSAKTYRPDAIWPEHQDKCWREALGKARDAGWTLIYINAPHRFGVVSCPEAEHTFKVGKTPRGSETLAREAEKKVSRCGHLPQGLLQERRDQASRLLDVADQIASEVAEGLERIDERAEAYKLFDALETAAANVAEVLRADHEAALEAAVEADDAAPDPLALEEDLDEASASVSQGKSAAKSLWKGHPGAARPLLLRASGLDERVGVLREQLESLREQM